MDQIVYKPIGYIQTPFQRPENTPLPDIKSFIPNFDNPEKVKTGWFAKVSSNFPKRKSDNRFN